MSPSTAQSYRRGYGENILSYIMWKVKAGKSEFLTKFVLDVIGRFLNFLLFGNMLWKLLSIFVFQKSNIHSKFITFCKKSLFLRVTINVPERKTDEDF